jgi:hypothetical protein
MRNTGGQRGMAAYIYCAEHENCIFSFLLLLKCTPNDRLRLALSVSFIRYKVYLCPKHLGHVFTGPPSVFAPGRAPPHPRGIKLIKDPNDRPGPDIREPRPRFLKCSHPRLVLGIFPI